MSLPKINLRDGKHRTIIAEEGERVLTPEQNKEYEATHPDARMKPMRANIADCGGRVYDAGGSLGSVGGGMSPDQALVVAKSEGTTAGAVQPGMVRSDSPLAADSGARSAGTVAGQGDVGGKHVPIRGMTSTHTSNDDPLLDASHPQGNLGWAYDKGGPVQTPLGNRIADRANELYMQAKALHAPESGEAASFKEKQANIDAYKKSLEPAPSTAMKPYPSAAVDKVNPAAKTSPEEKRIDPRELQDMQKPLGSLPLYDEGGDVPTDDEQLKAAAQRQAEDEVMNKPHLEEHSPEGRDAQMRRYPQPQSGIARISNDTERPAAADASKTDHLTGATMDTDNAPLGPPKMENRNASVEGPTVTEASAKPTPLGQVAPQGTTLKQLPGIEKPMGNGTTDQPMDPAAAEQKYNEDTAKVAGRNVEHEGAAPTAAIGRVGALPVQGEGDDTKHPAEVPAPDDAMATVQADKLAAMKKGTAGLTDLGTSLIHEKALKSNMPQYTGKGADEVAQGEPIVPEDKKAEGALQHSELEAKRKDYDRRIQAAMDQGTPEGDREAASLQLAKSHFDKANPYGSAANHPGFLGKLGHIASRVGEGALDAYAGPNATATLIPGSPEERRVRETEYRGQQGEASKETLEAAQAHQANAGSKLAPTTQVFDDLKGQVNPETGQIYTDQERLDIAQNPGKAGEVTYARKYQKDHPDSPYEEGVADYYKMKAGNKPLNEHEKRVADYVTAHNMEDNPANRETARIALEKSDVNAKQESALPFSEAKSQFNDRLSTTRALLVQQNADANTRGLKADELQQTENARSSAVNTKLNTAKDALNAADDEQFAAQIVPIVTLLSVTSAEGVKRVNKQELDKFVPTSGSFGRWIDAHAEQFLSGKIPAEYRTEVGHMIDRMTAAETAEHIINTGSIDGTVRQGAQQPVQKPEGGAQATPAPSKPQAPAATATKPAESATGGFATWKQKQNQPK
jgi:hypothetical protein